MSSKALNKRIKDLERICGETYQVVGSLAGDLGVFGSSEEVRKVLDNLSQQRLVHHDVLPFPSFEKQLYGKPVEGTPP